MNNHKSKHATDLQKPKEEKTQNIKRKSSNHKKKNKGKRTRNTESTGKQGLKW